jgi:endoglucanase
MMSQQKLAFLLELLNIPSPSGFEAGLQRHWLEAVRPWVNEVGQDSYGTAWAIRQGTEAAAPRLMLEAHADEVGFIVQYISEEGFLHIAPIGGADRVLARARRVRVLGSRGAIDGVLGHTAIHLRDPKEDRVPEWHELFVDVGARSRDEVAALGIRVGHPIVLADEPFVLDGRRLVGRALDNRLGGFILVQVLQALANEPVAATVYAVNAVQEETGGYGARMVAYRLHPELALVLEVTHATDVPGIETRRHGLIRLGGGPVLTHGTANHPLLVERLLAVAEAENIPVQHEASSRRTGTDADDIFATRGGIPCALVSVPLRYMHSPVEMIDLDDVAHTVKLLVAFVRSLRAGNLF